MAIAVTTNDIAVDLAQLHFEVMLLAVLPAADCCLQGECGTDTVQESSRRMRMRLEMGFCSGGGTNPNTYLREHYM